MINLYVISKEDPIQPADEVGRDLKRIDGLLSLDLDDSDEKKRAEHRTHKRFKLNEDGFALIRPVAAGPLKIYGKSMGCVACAVFDAKPAKPITRTLQVKEEAFGSGLSVHGEG